MPGAIFISVIELSLSWPGAAAACGWPTTRSVVPSVRMSNHVKMVLRLIGVGQHPKVYKVMDDPSPSPLPDTASEKGCS